LLANIFIVSTLSFYSLDSESASNYMLLCKKRGRCPCMQCFKGSPSRRRVL